MKLHLARLNGRLKSTIFRYVTDETAMDFNALPLIVRFFLFIEINETQGPQFGLNQCRASPELNA